MTLDFSHTAREYRLARYYLGKLRTVDEAIRRGQIHLSYGRAVFDNEWEQIRHWQIWTTRREPEDRERAQLCRDFALAGLEVLANRINSADHAAWLHAALEAAEQLDDGGAERTLCYELMMMYYRVGSLETGKRFASRMLTLGETASDVLCIERAFFGLAVYSEERGLYVEAERDYHRALRLSNQLGIAFETGRALNALGGVAQYVGEFEKSHQYASQYLDLMETHGHQSRVCHALISVGESLISLKAYTEAERNLQRAVRMCRALGLQRLLGVGLLTLGSLAIEQDQLEVAQTYLQEGLLAVRAVGVQRQVIDGLTRLGYLDLRHQDFAGALDHLHEALAIALDVGNPRYLCDVQLQLAQTYLALDDLSAARSALQTSLHITHSLGSHPRKVRNLSYVIAYCECLGQYERAANWAGTIIDEVMIDRAGFATICARLEATLGRNRYEQELEEGKERPLDGALSEALAWLA